MNGVNRKRQVEAIDISETEVFKKCYICRQRPYSIRCADCHRDHRAELMCYSCSRKVHSDNLQHAYEYATFREMLVQEEERSFQDTDSFPANGLLRLESRGGKPFYDDEHDRLTQEGSLISAVDVFVHPTDSPAKKQYQTFGRRSDRVLQGRFGENSSEKHQKNYGKENKENYSGQQFPIEKNLKDISKHKNLSTIDPHESHEETVNFFQHRPQNQQRQMSPIGGSDKPNHDRLLYRDTDDRRPRLPPRNERSILRELQSNPQGDRGTNKYEQGTPQTKQDRAVKSSHNSGSIDHLPPMKSQDFTSPLKISDFSKVQAEGLKGFTPSRSGTKNGHDQRLLSGSCWKSKSKGTENQPQLLHSPAYIDSITELHRTEIESMKTKHRVEIDRLESELSKANKNFECEVRSIKDGAKEVYEEVSRLHLRVN